ncbi:MULTISPECIES: LuxR C-terminal-related transcriptional regulator [unclassified Variovorax]|uniref:helix-turn-helix transcriptional regulator n=1 Tax=unclassified Variovorax TaxID=663243 RepID=UPI001BD56D61|nr:MULTISPECIES: LuxR C-terminal-related transcriptional regulator [unclassified Variovorax]
MKRRRIHPSTQPESVSATVAVGIVAGIGTPHLADGFLAAMQKVLPLTFCTVFALGANGRVVTVSTASNYGDAAFQTSERYIENRFDLLDPNMVWLSARKLPKQAQLWLSHQHADEVADPAYRAACYGDVGIRERTSVLLLLPGGQRAAVSFYRSLALPEFVEADFDAIAAHAALLAEATAAHSRGLVGAATPRALGAASSRLLSLSVRERAVIDHLLAGRTAKEAAREMDVELSTARTHQYRAFRRLGIASLKDLLMRDEFRRS